MNAKIGLHTDTSYTKPMITALTGRTKQRLQGDGKLLIIIDTKMECSNGILRLKNV